MVDKRIKEIIRSLAMPVFYVPVYKTPQGKYYLDRRQILSRETSPVKASKYDTFVFLAQLTTKVTGNSHLIGEDTGCSKCKALVGCEQARGGTGACGSYVD